MSGLDKFFNKKRSLEGSSGSFDQEIEDSDPESNHSSGEIGVAPKEIRSRAKGGRIFQEEWLSIHSWLTYDPILNLAFCSICKRAEDLHLFSVRFSNSTFITKGWKNWRHARGKKGDLIKHEQSKMHLSAIESLSALGKESILDKLDSKVSEQKRSNTMQLYSICSAIEWLGKQGLALRGHTVENSNFQTLIELLAQSDNTLFLWLKRKKSYTSAQIQNEILKLYSNRITYLIISKIKSQPYWSLMLDECMDLSGTEQLSCVFRTANDDLEVMEEYLGMYALPTTDASTIFEAASDIVQRYSFDWNKCRGQGYDGAAAMSGIKSGVQQRIRAAHCDFAYFVHCQCHNVSLMSKDALLNNNDQLCPTVNYVKQIINFIRGSPKRTNRFRASMSEILQKRIDENEVRDSDESDESEDDPEDEKSPESVDVCVKLPAISTNFHGLRPLCPTRWTLNYIAVSRFLRYYREICDTLEFIAKDKMERGDARATANGLLDRMEQFGFYFYVVLLSNILNIMDSANTKLQKTRNSIAEAQDITEYMRISLKGLACRFPLSWDMIVSETKLLNLEQPKLPRGRYNSKINSTPSSPQEYYLSTASHILDSLDKIIEERSQGTFWQQLVQIDNQIISDTTTWDNGDWDDSTVREVMNSIDIIKLLWPNDFNIRRLLRQLITVTEYFKSQNPQTKLRTLTDLIELLRMNPTARNMNAEVIKFCKLYLVIPSTTCTVERSFSAMRRLKSFLRTTMAQKRYNWLSMIYAHRELVTPDVRTWVINEFIDSEPCRGGVFSKIL